MQYLALIYGDEARWSGLSPEQRERRWRVRGALRRR